MRYRLGRGADLDFVDEDGLTALHHACLNGHESIILLLIDAGADLEAVSPLYGTPLCVAALRGEQRVIELLLSHKAEPEARGGLLGSPVHAACFGSVAGLGHLLRDETNVYLIRRVDFTQGHRLLDGKPLFENNEEAEKECTPLYVAAAMGDVAMVQLLIELGATMDGRAGDGMTALMASARNGRYDCVDFLIRNGSNANLVDDLGTSAFTHAQRSGHVGIVELLWPFTIGEPALSTINLSASHIIHPAYQKGPDDYYQSPAILVPKGLPAEPTKQQLEAADDADNLTTGTQSDAMPLRPRRV